MKRIWFLTIFLILLFLWAGNSIPSHAQKLPKTLTLLEKTEGDVHAERA